MTYTINNLTKPVDAADASGDNDASEVYTVTLTGKDAENNIIRAVLNGVKSLFKPVNIADNHAGDGLKFYAVKDANGDARLRFMAVVSNNFKDRDSEIITEAAHHEYVDWATRESVYPELWLWHSGAKSRWGQVDWLDVSDGFLVASGLVDLGKEYIAHNLEKEATNGHPSGVSHGFLCVKSGGEISRYRTFEISPLSMDAAANEWTGFNVINGESMSFTAARKKWLHESAGVPMEAIETFEASAETLAKELKSRGVEYKDVSATQPKRTPLDAAIADIVGVKAAEGNSPATPDVPAPAPMPVPSAQPVTAPKGDEPAKNVPLPQGVPDPAPAPAPAPTGDDSKKEVGELTSKIDATNTQVGALSEQVKELTDLFRTSILQLSKSEDEKTAEFFRSRIAGAPQGFVASQSAGNTGSPLEAQVKQQQAAVQSDGWWKDMVIGGISNNG